MLEQEVRYREATASVYFYDSQVFLRSDGFHRIYRFNACIYRSFYLIVTPVKDHQRSVQQT